MCAENFVETIHEINEMEEETLKFTYLGIYVASAHLPFREGDWLMLFHMLSLATTATKV